MSPVRLQLSRLKGFNLQALSRATNGLDAVKVDRSTRWGNPFVVGKLVHGAEGDHPMTLAESIHFYREFVASVATPEEMNARRGILPPDLTAVVRDLRGKNLACWCKPGEPCHADVLLEIANA